MNVITLRRTRLLTLFTAAALVAAACVPQSHAANPNRPGGGGGDTGTASCRLVLFAPTDAPCQRGLPFDV